MAGKENADLGNRIRQRREDLGLTQADLAREVGMKQQGIQNIEAGIVRRPRLLMEIAEALHTTEKWLLRGDTEHKQSQPPATNPNRRAS